MHLKYLPLQRTPRMWGTIQAAITSALSTRMLTFLCLSILLNIPTFCYTIM